MRQNSLTVHDAVRAELARRRLNQSDLAAVLNVSQRAISRRLAGEVPFTVAELIAVSDWLNVGVTDLLAAPIEQAS